MINDSVSRWVGGQWVGGKVLSGLILIFSIFTINKKRIWSSEAATQIFNYT